ncbi:MAG TPA: WYL domain-containing protein [Gemmatimonadales bacterium]|nr:WYL domain-containing protein [Gemmatimonadales bacterium]
MTQPKVARWLDLLAYLLQHRYPVTREQIFEAVAGYREGGDNERARESARRAFERDKAELKQLGIEISRVSAAAGEEDARADGYQLAPRDFYLPYLELVTESPGGDRPYPSLRQIRVTRDDMRRLDRATARFASLRTIPLAAAAATARRKLGFDLPLSLRAVESVLARPLSGQAEAALATLQRAVAERRAVRCTYRAIGRDATERRTIEPLGLFFQWSRWYCVARDRGRDALRVFRVDRMRAARQLVGADAGFTVPQGFSIRAYVGRAPWELSEASPVVVRMRFAFPESRWVQAQGLGTPIQPVLDDGGAILEFSVRERGPFLRWALTFGDRIEVLDPAAVRRDLAALRARVYDIYREPR